MTGGELGTFMYGASALGSLLLQVHNAWRSRKRDQKVEQIHVATNSLKDELVAVTRQEAFAAGKEDQRTRGDG